MEPLLLTHALVGLLCAFAASLLAWVICTQRASKLLQRALAAEAAIAAERAAHAEQLATIAHHENHLRDAFKSLSAETLQQSNELFLQLAEERLKQQQQTATVGLEQLITPLRIALDQQKQGVDTLEKHRQEAYGGVDALLRELKDGQQQLRNETANLVTALRKPQVRGRWGELQLRRVVELAGMHDQCDFEEQVTITHEDGRQRPDLLVRLPNKRVIVVDSKVPLEAFLDALNADEATRPEKLKAHARQIRQHVDAMAKRQYHRSIEGAHDFTVLFVPGEVFYQTALEHDHELLEYALQHSIILASPGTLIALLRSAALSWRETRLAEHAEQIKEAGEEIYKRIGKVAEHITKLGKALGRSVEAYNDTVGSIERNLLTSAQELHRLHVSSQPIEAPDALQVSLRSFVKPELALVVPADEQVQTMS